MPDKRDLGLGKPIVTAFAREILPNDFEEIRVFFSKKGAYPKFRALLARRSAVGSPERGMTTSPPAGTAPRSACRSGVPEDALR